MYYSFLKFLTPICLLVMALPGGAARAADRPNVLFIAIDDLNDWVSPLKGHPQVVTPAMDTLAARGTTFTNAHCQSPLCNPSRTSLMTGLRPSTTGVYSLAPWFRELPDFADRVTLGQYFQQNGYQTHMTGKIFHGGYAYGKKAAGKSKSRAREFEHTGPNASVGAKPNEKLVTTNRGNHNLVDWGVFPHRDEDKGDWAVASWAVETLETMPEDKPFFLATGFFLPHVPCYATQKWFDLYPEETLKLPPHLEGDREDLPRFASYTHWTLPEVRLSFLNEHNEWKNIVRSYLACVSFVDSQVGRVLEALEQSGKADNTVVVLWSDHGWHLGEKDITGKNTLWQRSTRVPLIFAGPGVAEGAVCNRPAELLDIYPTLVELCGLPDNDGLEGISLTPQLQDANAPRERPAITTHNQNNHSVVTEEWRYIRYADGSEELYDVRKDPNEWTNLAGDGKHDAVKAELAKWLPEVNLPSAPGSNGRVLTHDDKTGVVTWEGEVIGPEDEWPE